MSEDLSEKFSKNLREIREARGFTRESLAEVVECTATAIYKWESKGNKPSFVDFYKLMNALDVTFEELSGLKPINHMGMKKKSLGEALEVLKVETGIVIKIPESILHKSIEAPDKDLLDKIGSLGAKELDLLKRTVDKMLSTPEKKKKAN